VAVAQDDAATRVRCIKRTCAASGPSGLYGTCTVQGDGYTANAPVLSCLLLRDAAHLRSLVSHGPPGCCKLGCCGSTYTNAPRAPEALQSVIGRDEHLRAAAEMATAGHTWRAHASSISYLSGTHTTHVMQRIVPRLGRELAVAGVG